MSLLNSKIYDLGQPYFPGMPHYPTHPPFLFGLTKKHGDVRDASGMSSAADAISMGSHVGTHIDGLNHFSCAGRLFGGQEPVQSYVSGVEPHALEHLPPVVRRGVLLDVAGTLAKEALDPGFAITGTHLAEAAGKAGVDPQAGDVVLLRTGWARFFEDASQYAGATAPGLDISAARWLSERKPFAAGSDTIAFEKIPNSGMPVHVHLLVESGIHIIEVLNLEELARERVYTFIFLAAPMKIRGGTGGPVRPLAIVEAD